MTLQNYLEEKALLLITLFLLSGLILLFLYFTGSSLPLLFLFEILYLTFLAVYLLFDYHQIKKRYRRIIHLVDSLDQKYLITEVLPKPVTGSEKAYYYALKKSTKSMCDTVSSFEEKRRDYQEYIEGWIHEIKTPIAAVSLLCDNEKNEKVKREIKKIDNYVEQVLYYARSENTEKDYFIKETTLEEIVHASLIEWRETLLREKITLDVHDLDQTVYTDEKWIHFILNQLLSNSIKYRGKKPQKIILSGMKDEHHVILIVEDHGKGILKEDLPRIFEAGFTGSDRHKSHATGMGLYLAKKLCDKLNLAVTAESESDRFTRIKIYFPIGKVHIL